MDSPQPAFTRFLPKQMCTLGRQACTRRVCFFAHTSAELRETVPETLEETAKLRDKLLAEIFINPLYAKTLHQLLAVMSPAQASEVVSVPQGQILSYCKQSQLPLHTLYSFAAKSTATWLGHPNALATSEEELRFDF